ncbi:AAA family ATPase [Nocardia sp. NPDC006630]|uniref:bifunctional aminoglycoside phosphotransferase/ATP-binding protein n=1 Tax=Nocardia sp. NPDC006630 TaxID=3157181 RepID=UPI0033AEF1AA
MTNETYAQVRETHTGVVLLCGDRAYKAKKPVVTDFLDFGTFEAREHACRRELELNRRLAPDVYLGLSHLTDPMGGPSEPIVVMRRMPDSARLSAQIAAGTVTSVELPELAAELARFHHTALRGADIDRAGRPAMLRRRWHALLRSLAAQPPGAIDQQQLARVRQLALRFIDGRTPLLAARIAEGRIVDGHGDLIAEDIFALPEGFRILDCLDFDDELRHVDCLDDAAFLAMDLEFLGVPALAEEFLDTYLLAMADAPPAALRHHYIAYRAMVRAKTDRIRCAEGDPDAAAHARRHLEIADAHLSSAAIRLVLIGGLPGTGKSTVAAQLATRTGAEVISSDTLRAVMRRSGAVVGGSGTYGEGAYHPDAKALVYEQLLGHARDRLEYGVSVILDASWLDSGYREQARLLARQTHTELIELHCGCPPQLAATRLRNRAPGDSDATPTIADAMAAAASPWPEATVLDTERPIAESSESALYRWNRL